MTQEQPASGSSSASSDRLSPLTGIRVIELANFVAGPIATALMADMGADVIKVEPPSGDTTRAMRARGDLPTTVNYHFHTLNRGKRSVTVDLTKPGAGEVVCRLASGADVVVTNLLTERLERYGLGFEAFKAAKPDIVFAQLTGWGSSGPRADRPGFDATAYWAGSGLMSVMGEANTPAVVSRGGQGDYPTGVGLMAAILAALRLRDLTGDAQFVDVTLQRNGLWGLASEMELVLNNPGFRPQRFNRMAASVATRNSYQTSDDRWMMLSMHNAVYWRRFCAALEREEWADDPRYIDAKGALQSQSSLIPEIDQIFRSHDFEYWSERLDAFECVWAPAATLDEVAADEELHRQGFFTRVSDIDDEGHSVGLLSAPFTIHGADIRPRGRGPRLGEDTYQVFQEAGFEANEISDIAASGILG